MANENHSGGVTSARIAVFDHKLSRRELMRFASGGVLVAAGAMIAGKAHSTPEEVAAKISEFAAGAKVGSGRIKFDIPEASDNGASVPVTITVESPMTLDDHVAMVMIGAEKNPFPVIATFHFTPMSGSATVTTRIRLAESQTVTAVAKMSNGSIFAEAKTVQVTAGGC